MEDNRFDYASANVDRFNYRNCYSIAEKVVLVGTAHPTWLLAMTLLSQGFQKQKNSVCLEPVKRLTKPPQNFLWKCLYN